MNSLFKLKQWLNSGRTASKKMILFVIVLLTTLGLTAQQSYTFTTANAIGAQGPTQLQINTSYSFTNLSGSVTIVTQGIQMFTVPVTGAYGITALGAQGWGAFGGRGTSMYGEFQLTAGQVLKILVGQAATGPGSPGTNQYGGGGGSFVTDASNNPLIIAGGGGGNYTSAFTATSDASTGNNGNAGGGHVTPASNGAGGTNGGGGGMGSTSFGGGGLIGDGAGAQGGKSFINGGVAGTGTGNGGFGGGGGCTGQNNRRMGGGGGYSGGGGTGSSTTDPLQGGGGGSFNGGTNQTNSTGANLGDGLVVLKKLCNVNLTAASNPICYGDNLTLSTNAVSTITWSAGGSSSSIVVSPSVTTTYSVTGTGAGTLACIGSAVIVVTVMPLPNISVMVQPQVLCVGDAATLTASGAATYTWSSGPSGSITTVNPVSLMTYTAVGTDLNGCINSTTLNVVVNTNSLSVSPGTTVCVGDQIPISASGAISYTWNTGSQLSGFLISPTVTTVYSVTGTGVNNCKLNNSVSITVKTLPNISGSADKNNICKGESVDLTATGATTYTWTNAVTGSAIGSSINVTLPLDLLYTYTLTGTDNNGCRKSSLVTVKVNSCNDLAEQNGGTSFARVYPNPGNGSFTIESIFQNYTIKISDQTGRILSKYVSENAKTELNLRDLSDGIYFLKIESGRATDVIKIVKH